MKRGIWIGFLATVVGLVLLASPAGATSAPDSALTPGATSPSVTQANIHQTICTSGYTQTVRNVSTRTKSRVYAAYRVAKGQKRKYVIDHLVPLELGGSNDRANLWPQLRADAEAKDTAEEALHGLVYSNQVDLAAAQPAIETDWSTAQATMEQAAAARKQQVAQYVAAMQAAERQRQLDDYLASLPPPTITTQPPAPMPNCPNGTYVNTAGNTVCSPYSAPSPPAGATAQCRDGTYSFSQSRSGTCSSHGGVARWL
jgi:cytochrome c1